MCYVCFPPHSRTRDLTVYKLVVANASTTLSTALDRYASIVSFIGKMGSGESKAVQTDNKGNINNNNNFIFTDSEDTAKYHYYSEILLSIMTIIKLIEFVYLMYSAYIRRMKKKYASSSNMV